MASDSGVPNERLDERLVALRDGALAQGEKIVAQEEGDQGQAIVLTDSRVLVVKVGITATGVANGKIIGEFPLSQVTAVNVRKGPLGAVVQVCAEGREAPAPGSAPDNVVVFTGSQRMRKCDAIAARIESAFGKPVGRVASPQEEPKAVPEPAAVESVAEEPVSERIEVEPLAEEPVAVQAEETPAEQAKLDSAADSAICDVAKGGRAPRSLAEEMFAEMTQSQARPEPAAETPSPPASRRAAVPREPRERELVAAAVSQPQADELSPNAETSHVLAPNPNLPRPVHVRRGGDRVLVLFGLLIAALVVGVAVTAPLRVAEEKPTIKVSWSALTSDPVLINRQREAVAEYGEQVQVIVREANRSIAELESALRSGDKAALNAIVRKDALDSAWRRLNALKAPPGLADARDQLASGLFVGKAAAANISDALQSSGQADTEEAAKRITEARALISRGIAAIGRMEAEIHKQLAAGGRPKPAKKQAGKTTARRGSIPATTGKR